MKTTGGNPVRGKPSLSQNMAATDMLPRIPVSHCHFPGVGYGRSEGERGVYEGGLGKAPPWVESPVTLCIPA